MENKKTPFGLTQSQYDSISKENIDLLVEKHGSITIFPEMKEPRFSWTDMKFGSSIQWRPSPDYTAS